MISARIRTTDSVDRVSSAVLQQGVADADVANVVMHDDGMFGDMAATDGIYSDAGVGADCCAKLGPRTLRIKAQTRDAGGRRHATAIEFAPFFVLKTPDPSPAPRINSHRPAARPWARL